MGLNFTEQNLELWKNRFFLWTAGFNKDARALWFINMKNITWITYKNDKQEFSKNRIIFIKSFALLCYHLKHI